MNHRNIVVEIQSFKERIAKEVVGASLDSARDEWHTLLNQHSQAMIDLLGLRLTLEDHRVDVRKDRTKETKKVFRSKDKVRAQYAVGGLGRAQQFTVVHVANSFGSGQGMFGEEDFQCA